MDKITIDRETFKALASDTRLSILKALDVRQKTGSELSRELDLNKATVFEHMEKLASVGLVNKLEDEERKWVYYQLTWKGRRLLHPEQITIALLLSSAFAAGITGLAAFWIYRLGTTVTTFAGPTSPSAAGEQQNPPAAGASSTAPAPAARAADVPQAITNVVHDPHLAALAAAMAVLIVGLALASVYVWRSAKAGRFGAAAALV
ncbi:MAG: winged helix-turn-helix domain-containing protein [Thermoplasmatota archaeon]